TSFSRSKPTTSTLHTLSLHDALPICPGLNEQQCLALVKNHRVVVALGGWQVDIGPIGEVGAEFCEIGAWVKVFGHGNLFLGLNIRAIEAQTDVAKSAI